YGENESAGVLPGAPNYSREQFNGGGYLGSFGFAPLGARLYDPTIGRVLSPDPLVMMRAPGTSNPSAFAMNAPLHFTGPAGMCAREDPFCISNQGGGGGGRGQSWCQGFPCSKPDDDYARDLDALSRSRYPHTPAEPERKKSNPVTLPLQPIPQLPSQKEWKARRQEAIWRQLTEDCLNHSDCYEKLRRMHVPWEQRSVGEALWLSLKQLGTGITCGVSGGLICSSSDQARDVEENSAHGGWGLPPVVPFRPLRFSEGAASSSSV